MDSADTGHNDKVSGGGRSAPSPAKLPQWDRQAEIARIERELCRTKIEEPVDVPDGLLAKFGRDRQDSRQMTPALRVAASQARDQGNWADAVPVFREVSAAHPDYDMPYIWLAAFLKDSGRISSAITLLKNAAQRCRRRSTLLEQAGEFTLSTGDVRGAFHLFAQSIAVMTKLPDEDDGMEQAAFLYISELFAAFGDTAGARWARWAQNFTFFDGDFAQDVRLSASRVGEPHRSLLMTEVPAVSAQLRRILPV